MEDFLMIERKTGRHVMRSAYLAKQIDDAREKLAEAELAMQTFLKPEEEELVPEPDPAFTEVLNYWYKHGAPQLNLQDESIPFKSMADGTHYTSKAKYRTELKAREYEEVGDERASWDKIGERDEKAYARELENDVNKAIGEMAIND